MIKAEDIRLIRVVYKKINFSISPHDDEGRKKMEMALKTNVSWGVSQVRNSLEEASLVAHYTLGSNVVNADVELVVIVGFKSPVPKSQLEDFESEKYLIKQTVPYFLQLTAEMTEKLGLAPVVLDVSYFNNLIDAAKRNTP